MTRKIIIFFTIFMILLALVGRMLFVRYYFDLLQVDNNSEISICFYDKDRKLVRVPPKSKKSIYFLPRSKGGFKLNDCGSGSETISLGFYEKYLGLEHQFGFDKGFDFVKSECDYIKGSRSIWCPKPLE